MNKITEDTLMQKTIRSLTEVIASKAEFDELHEELKLMELRVSSNLTEKKEELQNTQSPVMLSKLKREIANLEKELKQVKKRLQNDINLNNAIYTLVSEALEDFTEKDNNGE